MISLLNIILFCLVDFFVFIKSKLQSVENTRFFKNKWYFDTKLDKYIFLVFTWIVWCGFMSRFGGYIVFVTAETIEPALVFLTAIFHSLYLGLFSVAKTLAIELYFASLKMPLFDNLPSMLWNSYVLNPLSDIDLSSMTDGEDLAAFAADVVEFFEQDKAVLLDSITDYVTKNPITTLVATGCYFRIFSSRFFKK